MGPQKAVVVLMGSLLPLTTIPAAQVQADRPRLPRDAGTNHRKGCEKR
jgi:hypothetical protein